MNQDIIEKECDKVHEIWMRKNRILKLRHEEEIQMWKDAQTILVEKNKMARREAVEEVFKVIEQEKQYIRDNVKIDIDKYFGMGILTKIQEKIEPLSAKEQSSSKAKLSTK